MKVTHFIQDMLPRSGGPPAVVADLSAQQMKNGDEVTIISGSPANLPEVQQMLSTRWADHQRHPMLKSPVGRRASSMFLTDSLDASTPDVIHSHGVFSPALATVAGWAESRKVRLVCSTHGMLHPSALGTKSLKKRVFLRLFPRILRAPKWLMTLNAEEADNASRLFNRNSCVVENGVNVRAYATATPDEFFDLYPQLRDRPYALFVGRLHPIKGLDLLVRSFAIARAAGLHEDLVVIGPEEGAGHALQRQIAQLGLSRCVHLLPPTYGTAKASAIAGCSFFAHRPRYEGFGVSVVEAMAAAKPVVTTTNCHLDRAILEGAFVPAEDSDEGFASAMLNASGSARGGNSNGLQAAEWVRANLTWPAIAARIKGLYLD
jgi:glycosyltransferase involved in cell wall biosynthesis